MAIEEAGHTSIGLDISKHMLDIAAEREGEGDLCLHVSARLLTAADQRLQVLTQVCSLFQDMGTGLPFRSGIFDGAISISAIQWLCYSSQKQQTAR